MNIQKIIIYTTLLVEVLGISIILPAFPELKTYYGIGDFEVTLGLAVYSLFAFLFAPLIGQRSDRIGRKTSLATCIAGTALSYLVLLIQPRYWLFLLSRIINGITGGNVSIIQAIITDISPDNESKNKNFGLLGAVFGLGFITGPFLGSVLLDTRGLESIFIGGGVLATIQFFILTFVFKNTNDDYKMIKPFEYNPLKTIFRFVKRPDRRPRLLSFFAINTGMFVINGAQSLYMNNEFGTSGVTYGYYLAVIGLIGAINQGFLVPKFWTKLLSQQKLLSLCLISFIIGYGTLSFMQTEILYIGRYYIIAFMGGAFGIIYSIAILSKADKNEIGATTGMFSSIHNMGMVLGTLFGGLLLETSINMHRGAFFFVVLGSLIMIPTISKLGQKNKQE